MTRNSLPAGVPADNQKSKGADGTAAGPPEMAIPRFAGEPPQERSDPAIDALTESYTRALEFEDDVQSGGARPQPRMPASVKKLSLMIAIVALVGALGAVLAMSGRNTLPLCSDQPAWNQYNCRAG